MVEEGEGGVLWIFQSCWRIIPMYLRLIPAEWSIAGTLIISIFFDFLIDFGFLFVGL